MLLVFEGGLTTDIVLLVNNFYWHVGYHYPLLHAFAAGASLCSTSLGTTLALLNPEWRKMRVGAVLMSAALLDDVVGLVIAAIITNLSSMSEIFLENHCSPYACLLSYLLHHIYVLHRGFLKPPSSWRHTLCSLEIQLILIISTLFAFVAGTNYAGTSEHISHI